MFLSKVAQGKVALPASVALVIVVVWGTFPQEGTRVLLTAAGVFVAAYLVDLLVVRCALLPLSMRLAPCLLLAMSAATAALCPSWQGAAVLVLFLLFCHLLFRTYQDRTAVGYVFFAFLMVGVASLLFVQILFFLPLLWLLMAVCLQMLTPRTWAAALLGVLVPYWCWGIYALYTLDATALVAHTAALATFVVPRGSLFSPLLAATVGVVVVVGIAAGSFLLWHHHDESIRSRMLYYALLAMGAFALLFLVVQPQHCDPLLRLVVACLSVVAAHYFSTATDRVATYLFVVLLAAVVAGTLSSLPA